MITDSEFLERIVAGIHAVTTTGADVTWNETINGRQFDVVVRFRLGTLRYFVVVEVKNRTRKAEPSDMDAFVTKANDQHADKRVFVTTAGFQQGAIDVAKRHAVDLFTVTFDEAEVGLPSQATVLTLTKKGAPKDVPPIINVGEPTLAANIESAVLVYDDGRQFEVPNEPSQMQYYANKSMLGDGRTLNDLIMQIPFGPVTLGRTSHELFHVRPPLSIKPPDDYFYPPGVLVSVECTVTGREAYVIEGNARIEPSTFTCPVVYTSVITGEASKFDIEQLPLGAKRVLVGHFYFGVHPLRYYYCAAISSHTVEWLLIESFQNGEKFTASYTQDIKYSPWYIPVSDKKIISRLQLRLENYLKTSKRKTS
ncbi:MAG: restriction endonuclease [Rhodospirillaceae bacterium]|nr:restriction endonuclease [Rhodospirillaceae bacterium]